MMGIVLRIPFIAAGLLGEERRIAGPRPKRIAKGGRTCGSYDTPVDLEP